MHGASSGLPVLYTLPLTTNTTKLPHANLDKLLAMEDSPKRRRPVEDVGSEGPPPKRNLNSLTQPISPPRKRIRAQEPASRIDTPSDDRIFSSTFQLTKIQDLPAASNVDAVGLGDILGDPL